MAELNDPLDGLETILYVKESPVSTSEPTNCITLAESSLIETLTALVVGASLIAETVIVTVEVLLSEVPSLTL